jgi:hypothetical protein
VAGCASPVDHTFHIRKLRSAARALVYTRARMGQLRIEASRAMADGAARNRFQ